ncbi:MAG: thermonuclease family protein [Bacteriovoracaceae bacterium]|jgi:endonuclease YncB( thermonuclease family)|nr:thermonuclease family protein [Bacteriovoracaceae bacterium]
MQVHSVILLYVALLSSFLCAFTSLGIPKQKCTKVIDGDTIVVGKKKVRLSHIDAPELKQKSYDGKPIGIWSKKYLEKLILGKYVNLKDTKRGYYKRVIAKVYLNGEDINLKMVKRGYAISMDYYGFVMNEAKRSRRGIFKTLGFNHPRVYRRLN